MMTKAVGQWTTLAGFADAEMAKNTHKMIECLSVEWFIVIHSGNADHPGNPFIDCPCQPCVINTNMQMQED